MVRDTVLGAPRRLHEPSQIVVACCATRYTCPVITASDLYVLAGALAAERPAPSLRDLGDELVLDHTVVHRALRRAAEADLYDPSRKRVNTPNFEELALHAARFLAPAHLGALTPGVPAAWAAEPVSMHIRQSSGEPPPVWPDALGPVRGQALAPLHPSAPAASEKNPRLGALLAILDSLRAGDLRVREVAGQELQTLLDSLPRAEAP